VFDTPVAFSGSHGATRDPRDLAEIRIGLFAPDGVDHPVGGPVAAAARLAIDQFNQSGGYHGVPLSLLVRWDDDPWQGGSKEMIRLVYEDSVWAVIGSVSGDHTHVAEQVVTKAWLPLLSPVSADPTLTYIRIPWMFRLPPDDGQQAAVIVRDGLQVRSLETVGVITTTDHDGRVFADQMLTAMEQGGVAAAFHFEVSPTGARLGEVVARAASFRPDGLIVRLPSAETLDLLGHLQRQGLRAPVLVPWVPGLDPTELSAQDRGPVLHVWPFEEGSNPEYHAFAQTYRARVGMVPTPAAAYAYDAVNMLVSSLLQSGLNHAALRDALADQSGYRGVTGVVSWDNAGGNRAAPVLRSADGPRP
jgi:ABC-type branched-subunit amino acid transport system substrate-binding protein